MVTRSEFELHLSSVNPSWLPQDTKPYALTAMMRKCARMASECAARQPRSPVAVSRVEDALLRRAHAGCHRGCVLSFVLTSVAMRV